MKYWPAYEDGTDSEFRNVGIYNSDAGELPKKEQITFRTRRKLKNKNHAVEMYTKRITKCGTQITNILVQINTNTKLFLHNSFLR